MFTRTFEHLRYAGRRACLQDVIASCGMEFRSGGFGDFRFWSDGLKGTGDARVQGWCCRIVDRQILENGHRGIVTRLAHFLDLPAGSLGYIWKVGPGMRVSDIFAQGLNCT